MLVPDLVLNGVAPSGVTFLKKYSVLKNNLVKHNEGIGCSRK